MSESSESMRIEKDSIFDEFPTEERPMLSDALENLKRTLQDHGITTEEAQAMDAATATMDNEQRFMQTASWADVQSRRFAREWDQGVARCRAQNVTKEQVHLHMADVVVLVLEANANWAREEVARCFREFGGNATRAAVEELMRGKVRSDRTIRLLSRRARRLLRPTRGQ